MSHVRTLIPLLFLAGACAQPEPVPIGGGTPGGTPGGLPSGTPAGEPTTTGTPGGTTTTTLDCTTLPATPAYFFTLGGYSTAEDFDFDGDGYAVAEYAGNLTGRDQSGATKVISPNLGGWTAGTRVLPTGDFAVAVPGEGSLKLIDGITGAKTVILGGLSYPNGVEVDSNNNVYTADQNTGQLIRVNAYDPDDHEIIAGGMNNPNGVILSPDETIAYVGSFGGGMIYAIDWDAVSGSWSPPRVLIESPGSDMGFDGINVDACGNVYWTEYIAGVIRRVTPDGTDVAVVADVPSSWIPNLRWGHDIGGWRSDVLYVSDRDQGRIFGIEVGIQGKRHVLMP